MITWFLVVGSLMVTMPSEDACKKLQPTVPGSECKTYFVVNLPSGGTVTLPWQGWQPVGTSDTRPGYFNDNMPLVPR